jgi:benzoyl-CoA reductase subunit C
MMISEFQDAYRNRHKLAEGWKKSGKKIFGYFCNYTPEELIYATGIIPVRIRGSSENVELADAHINSFCCSFMRSALDQALKGRYSYLDGMVFPKTCDMTRGMYSIWTRDVKIPHYYYLPIPGRTTDAAVEFFTEELKLFKESLEKYTGQKISDNSLKQAIKVYNENRKLLKDIYKLRLQDNPPVSGSQIFGVTMSGLILPKEQHSEMLRRVLKDIPSPQSSPDGKMRLMVAGNTFENIELLQAIEESGGDVVIDDIDTGTRYFWSTVDEKAEPLRALSERYLREIPCPCKHPAERRLDRMLELAKEYRVKGIILVIQKFCDAQLYDRPWLESSLKEKGYPVLVVEHSDLGWSGGKFKTMVQAFIEMLG